MSERKPNKHTTRRDFFRIALASTAMAGAAAVAHEFGVQILPELPADRLQNRVPSQASPEAATATAEPVPPRIEKPDQLPDAQTPASAREITSEFPSDAIEIPQYLQERRDSITTINTALGEAQPQRNRYEVVLGAPGDTKMRLVFIDMDGTIDQGTKIWTDQEKANKIAEFQKAFSEWHRVSNGNTRIDFEQIVTVSTGYRVDQRKTDDHKLWIPDIMSKMGYPNPDYFESIYDLDNDILRTTGADNAVTAFIYKADMPTSPDGRASAAYIGGPFFWIREDGDGVRPSVYGKTSDKVEHELGHIFGALDLYEGAKTPCNMRSGRRANNNASEESDYNRELNGTQRPCKLEKKPNFMRSLEANDIGISTREQVGLNDPEPLIGYDNETAGKLNVHYTAQVSSDGNSVLITGNAQIDPPLDARTGRPDLNINKVTAVQYSDGVSNRDLGANDNSFDSPNEGFSGSLPLNSGRTQATLIVDSHIGGSQRFTLDIENPQKVGTKVYLPFMPRY